MSLQHPADFFLRLFVQFYSAGTLVYRIFKICRYVLSMLVDCTGAIVVHMPGRQLSCLKQCHAEHVREPNFLSP